MAVSRFSKLIRFMTTLCVMIPLVSCILNQGQTLLDAARTTATGQMWSRWSDCRATYGDPSEIMGGVARANPAWQKANLVRVRLPWRAHAAWDKGLAIRSLQVHRLAAPSLQRALEAVWMRAGESQAEIDRLGLSSIGGGYNWRPVRKGAQLSTHAYGCAVDFDPHRNALGDSQPNLAASENRYVIEAFRQEGWVWGGQWPTPDGMHFQAARVTEGEKSF